MKNYPRTFTALRHLSALALAASLALPMASVAASITLATSPLATTSTSTVLPNLMFMLDDSGSMDWDYMPDDAKNFAGRYGFNSSQCNGVYYNPSITYTPPVDSAGVSYSNSSFSAAWDDGYNTGAGTTNLNTNFPGGSGSGASGAANYNGPAFYYTYSGTQTTGAQKDIHNTGSTFYQECHSSIDSTPGSTVFSKVRLSTSPTTTMTVSTGAGNPGTITVSGNSNGDVSHIKVNGLEILNATTSRSRRSNTVANNIVKGINNCTTVAVGNCTTTGFSATIDPNNSSKVLIASPASAGGYYPIVTEGSNTGMSYATTIFPTVTPTSVTSITVNGTQLLLSGATSPASTTRTDLAAKIAAGINAVGYSATVSGDVVTVTGPTSASTYTPVITTSPASGGFSVTTDAFPESTPSKLQNFANWYSYYSNRMLMMKTGVGQAFSPITDSFRVGFMTMNNNVSPDIVDIAPFNSIQRTSWYSKLYNANPGNSTPLREVLAKVGNLYAHKYGSITTYTATITVGGSGSTSVDSITVNGEELLADASITSSTRSTVAKNIAGQFIDPSSYTAVASGSTITITGPSSASGSSPQVSDDGGGMSFSVTTFSPHTSVANLNGITPADPVQYSCQQNFLILSTDGYWNGNAGYQVDGTPVDNQDGTVARPQYDGATGATTVTTPYTRDSFSSGGTSSSGCSSGKHKLKTQPEIGSCSVTTINGVAGSESCNWNNNGSATYSGLCVNTVSLPSPNPSTRIQSGTPVTTTSTVGGTSDTLADVAQYYANNTDLRTSVLNNCDGALGLVSDGKPDVCPNNVFKTATDSNTAQHMTTFTLGLGASGRMVYSPTYQSDSSGDYYSVANGVTAHPAASPPVCAWQADGTTCNWPVPGSGQVENIDDLWHAAVDGGGNYFSATDPSSLSAGLSNALAAIAARKGASAAAATSTLNPIPGNNYAYLASYTTVKWQGNLEARTIDVNTGVINPSATWCAESIVSGTCPAPGVIVGTTSGSSTTYNCVTSGSTPFACTAPGVFDIATSECRVPMTTACTGTMPGRVAANSDTRTIYTADSAGTALTSFGSGTDPTANATYAAANSTNFDSAKLSGLTQWSSLTATQQAAAEGANLVSFLRGEYGYEDRAANLVGPVDNRLYRYREATMGDSLESQPAFLAAPIFGYSDPGYSAFTTAYSSRPGSVFVGSNDGMLHVFATQAEGGNPTGTERWAYVPSMVIPNMWKLADKDYANRHTNYINGSPVISDICTANCLDSATAVWRTILVGGLNGGGRGYYALDVTDPTAPTLLWEFTTADDNNIGYSYGTPVITAKGDGTWVVLLTSGYNNTSPGDGQGYLYVLDAATGTVINRIGTGAGDTTTPSGLTKIAAWNDTPSSNRATYVYGGDLLGNVWRFDIGSAATPFKLAALMDPSGNPQPVTTTPVLGVIPAIPTARVIFIGTGQYLQTSDLSNTQVQSEYAIKDDNATATLVNPGGSPRNSTTLVQQTLTAGNGIRTASDNPVDWTTGRGWYVDWPDAGERVNIDGRLVSGTLLVASIVPSNTVCSPGGYGYLNFFDYKTGSSVNSSGIVSASYNNTIVGLNILYIGGSPVLSTVDSSGNTENPDQDLFGGTKAGGFNGTRVLWRELNPQ
jgi:type IV pilus assembly protein PilY1